MPQSIFIHEIGHALGFNGWGGHVMALARQLRINLGHPNPL